MDFTVLKDVEICSVGMAWPGAHGDLTFRFDHLADAVAAQYDPHIQRARVKLGHSDPTFNPDGEWHDPFEGLGDGYPALGSWDNLRLTNAGATLIGDAVEVPAWFAELAASAYPTRSLEGAYTDGRWKVETPGGKTYSFVLTGVAFGGLWRPAVEDLDDLQRFLTMGDGVVVAGTAPEGAIPAARIDPVSFSDPIPTAAGPEAAPRATADVDKVIEVFWTEFATEEEDRYWWWPRAVWTDPNELIVDDDEGGLHRVGFTSDSKQNVTFADPIEVLQTFTDAPAAVATAATFAANRARPAAHFSSRKEAGREGGPPASARTSTMNRAALLESLGLPADATDEQLNAAVAEAAGNTEPTPDPDPDPAPEPDPTPDPEPAPDPDPEPEPDPEPDPAPPAANADGTVTLDKATYDELRSGAKDGAAARAEQLNERRESMISLAVKAGKIPPARIDHYRDLHKADAKGTEELLEKLAPGVIPLSERGSSDDPASAAASLTPDSIAADVTRLFGPAAAKGVSG